LFVSVCFLGVGGLLPPPPPTPADRLRQLCCQVTLNALLLLRFDTAAFV
jgi:hypothetical protein